MSQPKVSIIVPVYNTSQYLERCFQSIVSQNYKNVEIIIINDGSTDNSGEVAEILAASINKAVVIHQVNQGPALARQAGLLCATGDYILFIDSDDSLEPDAVDFLVHKISSGQLDAVFCGFNRVIDGIKYPSPPRSVEGILSSEEMLKLLLEPEFSYIACMCFSKRELWQKEMLGAKKGMPSEDVLTNIKLVLKCNRVGVYDKRLYNYYQVSTSLTMTGRYFKQASWHTYFKELATTLKENVIDNKFDDQIKINEIHTFSFYIDKIVKDEWYNQILNYDVSRYPRKIRVLHTLLQWPWLLHLCVNGNRWLKRKMGKVI